MMRFSITFLFLVICSTVYARDCDGTCGQGEGDCDWDSECLPGLVCKFDWWFGDDYCEAGPDTKNFEWDNWEEWSDCSGSCGGAGERTRHRSCIPPVNGGYQCPAAVDSEIEQCDTAPCPTEGSVPEAAWCSDIDCSKSVAKKMCPTTCQGGVGNPKCNPNTWESYNNECCSTEEPCGLGEGDCDNNEECHGDLVCGKNNCRQDGSGFTRQADCCQLPKNSAVSDRSSDAEWCNDINCSTRIGKKACPNTCKGAEYVPGSDAEWCNDIDCSTVVAKKVCKNTCK